MPYLEILCLNMPEEFPADEYISFMVEARRVMIPDKQTVPAWKEFAGASNLIGWRYRASADAWREHRESLENGTNNHEDLYSQEQSLFMMFVAGVSCIESTCYAMAAAASHPQVCALEFNVEQQRQCSPGSLRIWLEPHVKAAQLVGTLSAIVVSQEWRFWLNLRNRMAHRSNLPRWHYASVGGPPPQVNPLRYASTSSTPEIDADFNDWDALHKWLAHQLRELLIGGMSLLRKV